MRVFVTGASGCIGSAVVPELIGAGHQVVGLARSDASAAALVAAGAAVQRGTLDDLDSLHSAAAASDGVIHLAFMHDSRSRETSRRCRTRIAAPSRHSAKRSQATDRPFVIASGTLGLAPGRVATEQDEQTPDSMCAPSVAGSRLVGAVALSFAARGVRSSVVRLSPSVHGEGDHGFMAALIAIARDKGVSGYIGDGSNRWPAVHRFDAAQLFRLALETAPAGSVLHGVADEGVPIRAIAEVIGRHLNLPVVSISPEDASEHFGWLGRFLAIDSPASSALTRELVGVAANTSRPDR